MTAIIHRPLRGSRISTFYPIKNLPSLASLDSAFQLQEYISLLIRLDVHDVNTIVSLPGQLPVKEKEKEKEVDVVDPEKKGKEGERDVDVEKGKNEPTVDEACWIYEQLRRLAQDLSHPLITTLQQECTRASCPEMKAGEWLYLCVAHGNDGAMEHCCAIDYILHTVDSATALLNSPRTFPSRLQIPVASHRHFSSLARRLGRIFAHAYFHHREAFEQAEAESSLYARFLALTERFDLVPAEFLVIPTNGTNVGGAGDSLGLGPPPRSPRDEIRRNEFDRGIGESPSPSSRSRQRTGTMVFAEAEANAVTDELARSSLREREQEPQKIELLERDGQPMPLHRIIPIASENEEMQFEISLSPGEVVAPEVFEDSPGPVDNHELPSILELNLEPEAAGNATEIAELSSAPDEPEANVTTEPLSHPSESSEPVEKEMIPTSTSDTVADQPKEPEVKSEDSLETQSTLTERTTDIPPADDSPSMPESILIPEEALETATTSTSHQEAITKPDAVDDKEIDPPITGDDVLPVPVAIDVAAVEAPKVETEPEPEELNKIESTDEALMDSIPAPPEGFVDSSLEVAREEREEEESLVVGPGA